MNGENMKRNLLLLHGWDYDLYSSRITSTDAWQNYKELIFSLKERFNVYKLNFPGFCKQEEPDEKEWNVHQFAEYVDRYIITNELHIDYVLGYSFGGAVAVKWKTITQNNAKLILVAPAIIRNSAKSRAFFKTPKSIQAIRSCVRDFYVIYIVKNNEMRYGTKFLRNSYQIIVREDLREDLFSINSEDIKLIFGTKDTAVAPETIIQSAPIAYNSIYMIDDANHDNIITDYVEELVQILDS